MFYAIINYQFQRSELKNVEKLVKERVQALSFIRLDRNVHFCTICEILFLVGGPWKSNVVLEKSLKNGCNFLYEPCLTWPRTKWMVNNIENMSFILFKPLLF